MATRIGGGMVDGEAGYKATDLEAISPVPHGEVTTAMLESRPEWLDSVGEASLAAALGGAPADGALEDGDRQRLESAAAADPRLAREMASWRNLHRALRDDRIAVKPGFTEQVMAALPEPAWQSSAASPRIYPVLVAALLACTLGATLLLAGLADLPLAGTGLALADFLQTTLLAGSGLLAATWVGLGFGLEELFAGSGASLAGFAMMVLCLDLLFVSLLRRRGPLASAARQGKKD